MSEGVFQRYSACYDLLYRDKDYQAEATYVARTLQAIAPQVRALLEFGSGTGKHGRILASYGYHVLGVERSEPMLEIARSSIESQPLASGGSFDCVAGDIQTVELRRTFDGVLALFHVVSYQNSNSEAIRTFASAARHLVEGGVFIFDVWHGPAVLGQRPSVRVKRVEDDKLKLTRIAEPELDIGAGIVTVRYTMILESKSDRQCTTFTEDHRMRYFFPTEIDLLARQTGFELLRSEEFLSGKPPGNGTWGVAYVLRRIS